MDKSLLTLMKSQAFVGGAWVAAKSGATFPVVEDAGQGARAAVAPLV